MLDLKITGGTIVDGSGAPGYRGDIGVKDGRIVAIGKVDEDARETLDATGKVVAPGFVDCHTHYDAQVFWDPTLSPSCFHGVTTVMAGFCGFSIAPCSPEAAGYLMPMLARVEGMPLKTLEIAVPWNWQSFGEYLSRIEGKIGLNAGFFAGHSAIRRVVMGERAVGEKSTPEELEKMKTLLGESLAQGALGFSTTISPSHNDGAGEPVPSRWADYSEIIELGRVVSEHEGTGLELLPEVDFKPEVRDLITELSIAGQRAVNWNAIAVLGKEDATRISKQLAVADYAREKGGEVIALAMPGAPDAYVNLRTGCMFDANPGMWREVFKWPLAKRMDAFRDPELRKQLWADLQTVPSEHVMKFIAEVENLMIKSVTNPANKKYEGRVVADIAKEEGRHPIDVLFDVALDDELSTGFSTQLGGNDEAGYALRGQIWRDDRTLIGASDAGAHIDMIDTFAFSTTVLEKGVRENGVVTLEEAVYQMTDRSARYMGLIDRGLLKEGYHADIVVFDDQSIARGPTYFRHDVPGDQFRLYADAAGVDHVFVNGVQIVRNGEHTGALPGTVLRSGRDTRTVPIGAMRESRAVELETAGALQPAK